MNRTVTNAMPFVSTVCGVMKADALMRGVTMRSNVPVVATRSIPKLNISGYAVIAAIAVITGKKRMGKQLFYCTDCKCYIACADYPMHDVFVRCFGDGEDHCVVCSTTPVDVEINVVSVGGV